MADPDPAAVHASVLDGRINALAQVLALVLAGQLQNRPEEDRRQFFDALTNLLDDGAPDAQDTLAAIRREAMRETLTQIADETIRWIPRSE